MQFRHTGRPDPVCIVFGLLVAFDDGIGKRPFKTLLVSTNKVVLPAPELETKFNVKNIMLLKIRPILLRTGIVFTEQVPARL